MAEIFGAVASGAGLMSLSMQLLESSQKLKGFYNASRDAPQTVADLSFELETIPLSLRQLVVHRQADLSSDTLLGRCMTTCTLMTTKIESAVDKMEHHIRKSRGLGRMYVAFKEPEILRLLESLEHAKSSMLFAYMSYCQSWNLRQATLRAAEAQSQNALLSAHEAQLQDLSLVVQSGHASILERIENTRSLGSNIAPPSISNVYHTRQGLAPRSRTKGTSAKTLRLALPRWLAHYVWEFAVHEIDGAWNFRVRPINIRPYGTFAFDVVRSGNVAAVRKLLVSGELSMSDYERDRYEPWDSSLLFVAAKAGRLELCEFLLSEFSTYYSETDLHRVLKGFIRNHFIIDTDNFDKLMAAFYKLFLRKHGISAGIYELIDEPTADIDPFPWLRQVGGIGSNLLLTEETLQEVIASQTIPFEKWHPTDRFCAAVNARGWPTRAFIKLIDTESDVQLAQWADRRGKTALHWAAENFGCCLSQWPAIVSSRKRRALQKEYGELCTMLIANGADPNALDSDNRTPFTCFLRAIDTYNGWRADELCDAVVQWGQRIKDAGLSLHAYVVAENTVQSRFGITSSDLHIISNIRGPPWTCRLIISEGLTLAIEVGFTNLLPLWRYSPPPGAWERGKYQIEKIAWLPRSYFEGDESILWKETEDLSINLQPMPVHPHQTPIFQESAASAWRVWATGVQDDHGFVCMTLRQLGSVSRERGRARRAASLPPPTTMLDDDPWTPGEYEQCTIYNTSVGRWMSKPHKCPLDLIWKSTYRATNDYLASRRRCMLGQCDDGELDLLSSRYWEVKLLDDERNIETARRFANRFRPEWRHIVEENHTRRQRRAELGMPTTSMS